MKFNKTALKSTFERQFQFVITGLLISFLFQTQKLIAQDTQYKAYSIGFYNVENLFDTLDNTEINDEEFTPGGKRSWTKDKYEDKIANLASVISQLGKEMTPHGLAILGISEIENDTVLNDLIRHPNLASRPLSTVHHNSSDRRGIDVAMIYDTTQFKPLNVKAFPVPNPKGESSRPTRDVLLVSGLLNDQLIHCTVNHWPSRSGGEKRSFEFRNNAAKVNRSIVDSLTMNDPDAKIIIMGDLNDDPTSESIKTHLRAKYKKKAVGPDDLYNPMHQFYKKGYGSNAYRDKWSLFDQIIVSHGLLEPQDNALKFYKAQIFNKPYLIQKFGKYKGYPFRTFDGDNYVSGYSDHLPVFIYLLQEVE